MKEQYWQRLSQSALSDNTLAQTIDQMDVAEYSDVLDRIYRSIMCNFSVISFHYLSYMHHQEAALGK